jgi:hypothetical protein
MTDSSAPAESLPNVAYISEPYWHPQEGDRLKSLLLFFDGIALLVPDYIRDRPLRTDPTLAQPLDDLGLLHRLSPESLVDQSVTDSLVDLLDTLLGSGAFDGLDRDADFTELSYSRLGYQADAGLTEVLVDELRQRGLARESKDGVSLPMHPAVRGIVLTALSQLLRGPAEKQGLALQPVYSRPERVRALLATLDQPALPTAGHVVKCDLDEIAVDLSTVPLDETLDFRTEHGLEFRSYARNLREFVRHVAVLDDDSRAEAFADRREAIADHAHSLRRLSRKAWNRPLAGFGLGIGGSAVNLFAGNLPGAILAGAGGLLGLKRQADPGSAYGYLFGVQQQWSGR